jgi:hypothetical protein
VDLVAAQSWVSPGLDLNPGLVVAGDVVVLHRPQTILVDKDPTLLPVVDPIAPQAWISSVMNRDTRAASAGDITTFKLQAALVDIHPVPDLFPAELPQRQIGDAADVGLEQYDIRVLDLNDDLLHRALTDDLQGLVQHHALPIQTGTNQDAVSRPGRSDRRGDGGKVPSVQRVHHMGRRLLLDHRGPLGRSPWRLCGAGRRFRGAALLTLTLMRGRPPERLAHPHRQLG